MAEGNRGLASHLTDGGGTSYEPRRPPKAGFLSGRDSRLAELASGGVTTRVHEAVDPAACRIWSGHNRDYSALTEASCADLIASLRAEGRQEIPAIVRRVTDDPQYRFEVVCGARRHWSVLWLRAHDYPDFKFIVEPRELTDEEAFRVADLENRSRKDLSDFERSIDYARAIGRYYGGSQQRMAERLAVSKSWLSRYLDLARLPEEVVACFESPHVLGISHAAALAPLLNKPATGARMLAEAKALAAEQGRARENGQPMLGPAGVTARLKQAAAGGRWTPAKVVEEFRDSSGAVFLKARREGRGGLVITLPKATSADRNAVLATVAEILAGVQKDR
jgi:ParB family chromosome partitioning protein